MADVVLITGSAGGIGAAAARAFTAAGLVVVGYDRVAPSDAVAAGLAHPGTPVAEHAPVTGEATDETRLAAAVRLAAQLGTLRHVVAGAPTPTRPVWLTPRRCRCTRCATPSSRTWWASGRCSPLRCPSCGQQTVTGR